MKLIEGSIRYPVSTTVGVILVVLFGSIALFRIPIQLVPNVEEPKVTVTTVWPGASPQEVEREIVDEQEEQLKSLEGLIKLESSSSDSVGTITLTFQVGTPLDTALLRVSNRLEQVPHVITAVGRDGLFQGVKIDGVISVHRDFPQIIAAYAQQLDRLLVAVMHFRRGIYSQLLRSRLHSQFADIEARFGTSCDCDANKICHGTPADQ